MSAYKIIGEGAKRGRVRLRYLVPAVLALPIIAVIAFAAITASAQASLKLTSGGLASVSTPFGSGSVIRVSAVGGVEQKDVPVALRGHEIWPTQKVAPGERVTVVATVKRPGWISWLAGSTERLTLTEVAPVARFASTFITRSAGQPLEVKFEQPVRVVGSGTVGSQFDPHALHAPARSLTLDTTAVAGTVAVAAAVRSWESPATTTISWFPRGKRASVVAVPAPGSRITATSEITLTFSKPVNQVLGHRRPPVNPATHGVWHTVNAHTIVFKPTGYGYGLGATVQVLLPATVDLVGASKSTSSTSSTTTTGTTTGTDTKTTGRGAYSVVGTWTVPQPSTEALQELLAELGYLPVKFTPRTVVHRPTQPIKPPKPPKPPQTTTTTTTTPSNTTTAGTDTAPSTTTTTSTSTTGPVANSSLTNTGSSAGATTTTASATSSTSGGGSVAGTARASNGLAHTVAAEEAAITNPPRGKFSWRYANTPAALKALWSPTRWTELTKGAVMAFENTMGLSVDGVAGPAVWKALIAAAVKGERSNFGYTFVMVSEQEPESIRVWHDGKIVVHGPVNTGIPAAPTATGTYAVYEHLTVTTMSGINPDGTPYHDPGIPWVSYFNGGDALHGFIRASYGFPQSLGCVEMPYAQAGLVWPYTPIGTIVQVAPA